MTSEVPFADGGTLRSPMRFLVGRYHLALGKRTPGGVSESLPQDNAREWNFVFLIWAVPHSSQAKQTHAESFS
jgi:hypothetical protein